MRRLLQVFLFLLLLPLSGCAPKARTVELFAMDTFMRVTAYGDGAEEALSACADELHRLDKLLSATDPASDVTRVNTADGAPVTVAEDTRAVLAAALEVSRWTDGAFDATVRPLVVAWGFPTVPAVPAEEAVEAALAQVDYRRLTLDGDSVSLIAGMAIDLGGIAKGYTSDRAAALLYNAGVRSALVTLGGNVHALGTRPNGDPWRIGVQDPLDETAVACVLLAEDTAVITSGAYQRYFEEDGVRYHHILSPKTGRPADAGLLSATVIAKRGVYADALSTALFVLGEQGAEALWRSREDFEMVLLTESGELICTEGVALSESADGWTVKRIERG